MVLTKKVVKTMKNSSFLQSTLLDKKTEFVYRALLSLADAPASAVAKRSGIRRTSVYYILDTLVSMGLASSYQERGVRRFSAEHPSRLKTFFERQAILAERMIPDLEKEISKSRLSPSVKVFEGKDAVKSMSEGALSSKEKIIFSIGSTKKLTALLGGKYGWGRRRRALGLFQRALRFLSDETISAPARFHDVRILPDTFDFPGYLLIFDDSTAIIPFEKPVRGILITDHVFAVMAKSVFEILWKLGEKPGYI